MTLQWDMVYTGRYCISLPTNSVYAHIRTFHFKCNMSALRVNSQLPSSYVLIPAVPLDLFSCICKLTHNFFFFARSHGFILRK